MDPEADVIVVNFMNVASCAEKPDPVGMVFNVNLGWCKRVSSLSVVRRQDWEDATDQMYIDAEVVRDAIAGNHEVYRRMAPTNLGDVVRCVPKRIGDMSCWPVGICREYPLERCHSRCALCPIDPAAIFGFTRLIVRVPEDLAEKLRIAPIGALCLRGIEFHANRHAQFFTVRFGGLRGPCMWKRCGSVGIDGSTGRGINSHLLDKKQSTIGINNEVFHQFLLSCSCSLLSANQNGDTIAFYIQMMGVLCAQRAEQRLLTIVRQCRRTR